MQAQKAEQRAREKVPGEPVPHPRESSLSPAEEAAIKAKVAARTATRDEVKAQDSERRFTNRRNRGVNAFFSDEKARMKEGSPGTRAWDEEQKAALLRGDRPNDKEGQPMEGHHKFNASDYPHKAAEGSNIHPVTRKEHLEKWHDGNFQKDTHGEPLAPHVPDEF